MARTYKGKIELASATRFPTGRRSCPSGRRRVRPTCCCSRRTTSATARWFFCAGIYNGRPLDAGRRWRSSSPSSGIRPSRATIDRVIVDMSGDRYLDHDAGHGVDLARLAL